MNKSKIITALTWLVYDLKQKESNYSLKSYLSEAEHYLVNAASVAREHEKRED